MLIFLILTSILSFNVHSSECSVEIEKTIFDELNLVTIDDTQIVTEDDLRFCPDQTLKNSSITPDQLPDNGSVWRVGNHRWNDDWEKKYQQWVKDNVTSSLFEELDFPTDCADAAIAIRSIFARINNLPAAFNGMHYSNQSKSYKKYKTVTHWSQSNWKENFKEDSRFKKALKSWLTGTGTVNIHKDTYQVGVWDSEKQMPTSCIAPGTIVLSEGHTQILTYNKDSLYPYRLSSSTVPAKVRPLEENVFNFGYQHIPEEKKYRDSRGYVWWNWPINCKGKFVKVSDEKMPYYSSEQKDRNEKSQISYDLNKAYQESLGLTDEELSQALNDEFDKMLNDVLIMMDERQSVIDEGLTVCKLNNITKASDCFYSSASEKYNGKTYSFFIGENGIIQYPQDDYDEPEFECVNCPEELPEALRAENLVETSDYSYQFKAKSPELNQLYYDFSTPSRDERLSNKFSKLSSMMYQVSNSDEAKLKLLNTKVEFKNGKSMSLYHVMNSYYLSPQPWDSEEYRWGAARMHEMRKDFYHYNSQTIEDYQRLTEAYNNYPSEQKKMYLDQFEDNYKTFIAEKNAFDSFFN